jgi:acyl-homoserine lactone acylase PvdQ
MALAANSSNNTVYADADGHIAYFHPLFVPRRGEVARASRQPTQRRGFAGRTPERGSSA